MQIFREFVERRSEQRRQAIRAGIRAIYERRELERRADNFAICHWIDKFEKARRG